MTIKGYTSNQTACRRYYDKKFNIIRDVYNLSHLKILIFNHSYICLSNLKWKDEIVRYDNKGLHIKLDNL